VPAARAKVLDFAVALDAEGRLSVEGSAPLPLPAEPTPEHLLLAALVRCSLASLGYHARRAGLEARVAAASASGRITKREQDGRYAFVEVECRLDVALDPPPGLEDARVLLAKAERDCFVGASLTARPRYAWRVNGADVAASVP